MTAPIGALVMAGGTADGRADIEPGASPARWARSMPPHEVGHLDRLDANRVGLPAGIFVAGDAYRGVVIADGVRDANQACDAFRARPVGMRTGTERVR